MNLKLEILLRSVDIAAFVPGRIRLRSKKLVGNLKLEREIKNHFNAFSDIDEVETNINTGSILIKYSPDKLRRNPELAKAERYIAAHAKTK